MIWFALNEDRPLFASAGMWTNYNGDRGTKSKPTPGPLRRKSNVAYRTVIVSGSVVCRIDRIWHQAIQDKDHGGAEPPTAIDAGPLE
ncbi:hypothetical protein CQ12_41000 [Bradyrhizobium jicamae]|uniref:Uncharacterized protein n=1 Tax=Bradyrhizobium jicamae TaxID=280332 RepID=A0A0R3LXY6_9BRAD|nr:hypothetical protein CQ12_41000 [Bradyrhizobium jicamae]